MSDIEHPRGGLTCQRCKYVMPLSEVARQSPEWDIDKLKCPKCNHWMLGGGILKEKMK